MGAAQKDVSRKNNAGGEGVGVRVPSFIFLFPSFFLSSLSDFAPYSII